MNTIKITGAYGTIANYARNGGDIFENDRNNQIMLNYRNYLISINNELSTITFKLYVVYIFLNNISDITKKEIYFFLESLNNLPWNISYLERYKHNLRLFLNWLYQENYVEFSGNMVLPKIVHHMKTNNRSYYTKKEIVKMMNVIDINTSKGKEHYLIICFSYYLGLRISDIINLKLSNINFHDNLITLVQDKTNEILSLPLIDQVKYPLLDYLKNVRPRDCELDYIFVTQKKPYEHKIKLKTHSSIIKRYFIKANIDINGRKAGFHSLRHSFSTMLLSENAPLYSISTILGHQNISTTMLYLDIDTSKLKELALEVPIC